MKKRTNRRVGLKRDNSHCLHYVLIFPEVIPWLHLVNLFFPSDMLPLFFRVLLSYLVGMKRRTCRFVAGHVSSVGYASDW